MKERRLNIVKFLPGLLVIFLLAGCATTKSNIEARKQERISAYEALPQEMRDAVDHGNIKVGMPSDAVYISWGKPGQVLQRGSQAGEETIWAYIGGYVEETRYWGYRSMHYSYNPRSYVRAEVVFEKDVVKEWRTYPEPVY